MSVLLYPKTQPLSYNRLCSGEALRFRLQYPMWYKTQRFCCCSIRAVRLLFQNWNHRGIAMRKRMMYRRKLYFWAGSILTLCNIQMFLDVFRYWQLVALSPAFELFSERKQFGRSFPMLYSRRTLYFGYNFIVHRNLINSFRRFPERLNKERETFSCLGYRDDCFYLFNLVLNPARKLKGFSNRKICTICTLLYIKLRYLSFCHSLRLCGAGGDRLTAKSLKELFN